MNAPEGIPMAKALNGSRIKKDPHKKA